MSKNENLTSLFYPKNITIIGASADPQKIGNIISRSVLESGYQGQLNLINPKGGEILDQPVYTDIDELQSGLDLAIIVIPANIVLEAVKKLITKELKNLIVISAGFKEASEEGREREEELSKICENNNINLVGPNCLGIINNDQNSEYKFNGSFAFTPTRSGKISLISQSGAIISSLIDKAEGRGFGFNKVISVGNKADLDATNFITYLDTDDSTEVIALYLEGFKSARQFIEQVARTDKPVIILKAGRSTAAKEAVSSHTGTIAGNAKVAEAYLSEANAVQAMDMEEFFDTMFLFSRYTKV